MAAAAAMLATGADPAAFSKHQQNTHISAACIGCYCVQQQWNRLDSVASAAAMQATALQ
jgi:hypothetical protein